MDLFHLLTSWRFVLSVMFGILFISILVASISKPDEFQKSKLSVFISILAGVTVILIGLSLVVSAITTHEGEALIRVYSTKETVDKLWLYPNTLLAKSTRARPEFLKSFYYNNPFLQKAGSKTQQEVTCNGILEEQNIVIVMLQAWEDFLNMRQLDTTGDVVWLNNFLQWAQSPFLRQYYDILKYNYKTTTRIFSEILFSKAKKIPIGADAKIYEETAQETIKDPLYIELIKEINRDAKTFSIN